MEQPRNIHVHANDNAGIESHVAHKTHSHTVNPAHANTQTNWPPH